MLQVLISGNRDVTLAGFVAGLAASRFASSCATDLRNRGIELGDHSTGLDVLVLFHVTLRCDPDARADLDHVAIDLRVVGVLVDTWNATTREARPPPVQQRRR